MHMPRIQQSDQAIVINKPLAWTIVVALIGGGVIYGRTVGTLTRDNQHIEQTLARQAAQINAQGDRIGLLERGAGISEQRLLSIEAGIARIERWLEKKGETE